MELKPIRSADKKNMKITFYLSEVLYSDYKETQKKAKNLGYRIDLTNDFSTWFSTQLEQTKNALKKLESHK